MVKKFLTFIFYILSIFYYSSAMAYEEPQFEVIMSYEIFEVRKYSDRLAVETIETGQNNNFRKLFNYISGKNENNEKIQMTTPVTQVKKNGNTSMQFFLPSKFDLSNAPKPISNDIKIISIKSGHYAVLRYSGRTSDKNFIKHKEILEIELKKKGISIISQPIKATYDSPFTLPMNRRNEVMFKIEY